MIISRAHIALFRVKIVYIVFSGTKLFTYVQNCDIEFFRASQEYHFGNKEWSIVPTSGYPVRGGFGHSSVWDEITNRIYVYGGYVSTASTAAGLSNDLYSFDPIVKKWTFHSPGDNKKQTFALCCKL
jgi:hypothetical protein